MAVLLAGAAACAAEEDPKETVDSLREKSPTLQAVARRARIRIGVREDIPYVSYLESGRRTGFEIEIARALADELGYTEDKIEWVKVETLPARLSVLQQDNADMVVASLSMTAKREELVDFAGPYQLVPQQVLVRRDRTKTLATIADLRRKDVRVCTTTGSTSEKVLGDKKIEAQPVDTNKACMDGLRDGTYDAFSTDLPILAGMAQADRVESGEDLFELLDLAIADEDEKIGVAVPDGDSAMRKVIAWYLHRWEADETNSRWQRAYDKTIGPYLGARYGSQPHLDNPPDLADYDSKAPR
ncbi:glutamate-binding protein [Paractinoplanes abujensis]|uniref:Glutamate transport system substrate-binding protein n=1 Tax=Paractinoplanes abujensis TaxID=882441 RepID=A0A7W7FYI5_9ACTN|nr:transporter substrate-binding domain-containing protein [Actinoplanes abujensis]MBB4691073.1 glutamate transport system substrate-binding protein [Actinoplanes abujensis]GID17515.1 glutamate-binding protein [Actinoplanes abujensis]